MTWTHIRSIRRADEDWTLRVLLRKNKVASVRCCVSFTVMFVTAWTSQRTAIKFAVRCLRYGPNVSTSLSNMNTSFPSPREEFHGGWRLPRPVCWSFSSPNLIIRMAVGYVIACTVAAWSSYNACMELVRQWRKWVVQMSQKELHAARSKFVHGTSYNAHTAAAYSSYSRCVKLIQQMHTAYSAVVLSLYNRCERRIHKLIRNLHTAHTIQQPLPKACAAVASSWYNSCIQTDAYCSLHGSLSKVHEARTRVEQSQSPRSCVQLTRSWCAAVIFMAHAMVRRP